MWPHVFQTRTAKVQQEICAEREHDAQNKTLAKNGETTVEGIENEGDAYNNASH